MNYISALIQVKNAQQAGHETVVVPFSKMNQTIFDIMQQRGFVNTVEKKKRKIGRGKTEFDCLEVGLSYTDGVGAIRDISLISKPSRHIYMPSASIRAVKNGYGMAIISTSKGLMTDQQARQNKLGGELLCEIW